MLAVRAKILRSQISTFLAVLLSALFILAAAIPVAAVGATQSTANAVEAFNGGNNVVAGLDVGMAGLNLAGAYMNTFTGGAPVVGPVVENVAPNTISLPVLNPEFTPNSSLGSFSVLDWTGYAPYLPRPTGPLTLVEGADYTSARAAADEVNNALREGFGLRGVGMDIHEIQPIKFGGSPTDPLNKMILPRILHRQIVTPFWNRLQRDVEPYVYHSPGG